MGTTRTATLAAAGAGILTLPLLALPAAAADCIRIDSNCFATMAAALDAAADGDVIRVPAGTFRGGIVVTKSVVIDGAGQRRTRFRGGGPVITVGEIGDTTPPTVTIRDLTVTGGRTRGSDLSALLFEGDAGVWATGGGIEVPPSSFDQDTGELGLGASLRLSHVTVEGNRAAPTASIPSGLPCPGGEDCPFALAAGGGIDTSGNTVLEDTVVRNNRVGAASGLSKVASDSEGGGIRSWAGTLTISSSRVEGNSATAAAPNGRFAEGGGVFAGAGFFPNRSNLVVRGSRVTGNTARLDSGLPDEQAGVPLEQLAIGGGIQLTDQLDRITIDRSTVSGNVVRATNTVGSAVAFAGGLLTQLFADARITRTTVEDNVASVRTLGSSTGLAHADTGGLQLHGTLTRTTVRGNAVHAVAGRGDAEAWAGGMWVLKGDVAGAGVGSNRLSANAPDGTATVFGGGLLVDKAPDDPSGGLTVRRSAVTGNRGTSSGRTTVGRGGGIFDALVSAETGPSGGPLSLTGVRITGNRLSPKATASGGGLYVDGQPLALRRVRIRGNAPDQCVGCGAADTTRAQARLGTPAATAPRIRGQRSYVLP